MISPVTWLWNIRHRKLIEETKQIMRFYWFLRHDCGLRYADKLSAKELKSLLDGLKKIAVKVINHYGDGVMKLINPP